MIEFRCKKRDKTRTPIVYNSEIWEYAESVLHDYKPNLLKEPGKLNGIHFIESYLGATVDYQDIYYNVDESPIAGATIFNDDRIPVFDREGQRISLLDVKANTIIIDNSTIADGREGFANFTALHEGGHLCMHPQVYKRDANKLSLFVPAKDGTNIACCRKTTIDCSNYHGFKKYTPEMAREHQANVFAAFMEMPRQTFIPFAQGLIKDAGFENGIYVNDDTDWESNYYLARIINKLSETYGSSYAATKIHLRELKLLFKPYEYSNWKSQTSLFAN